MEAAPPLDADVVAARLGSRARVSGPLVIDGSTASPTRTRHVVTDGTNRWVVRQPHGEAAAQRLLAEDLLLAQLAESSIPVPVPVVPVDPGDGTAAFDVVTFVDGHRVRDRLPTAMPRTSSTRHDLSAGMVDVLIRLHNLDPSDVGLDAAATVALEPRLEAADRRLAAAGVVSAPLDELRHRLHMSVPPFSAVGVVHGTFHLSNLLYDREEPRRVTAVLGWEYSGVGDPLCDLGSLLALWAEDPDEAVTSWLPWTALTCDDGFFSRSTVAHEYMVRSRHDLRHVEWYVGLGYLELIALAAESRTPEGTAAIDGMAREAVTRADHSGIAGLTGT